MTTENEVWKPIPCFAGYEASTEGRIRNRRGHILTGTVTKNGTRQYNLRDVRRRRMAFGHRLVAATFLCPPPSGHNLNHLNGNKLDNRVINLEFTASSARARRAADRWRGECNPNAKLTPDSVREMRSLREQRVSLAELGRRFGVTERAAHRVVTRKDWKHVT